LIRFPPIFLFFLASLGISFGCSEGSALPSDRIQVEASFLGQGQRVSLGGQAEASLVFVERKLGEKLRGRVYLRVFRKEKDLPASIRSGFRKFTVALAERAVPRVTVLRSRLRGAPPGDLRSVLTHEFVHLVLFQMEKEGGAGRRLPLWFHEGLAQEIAGARLFDRSGELLAARAASGHLLSWMQLRSRLPRDEDDARFAYVQAADFFAFLMEELGLPLVMKMAREYLSGRAPSLDAALAKERWESFTALQGKWKRLVEEGRGFLRILGNHLFDLLLVLSIPLLFLVLRRVYFREKEAEKRLEDWETSAEILDGIQEKEAEEEDAQGGLDRQDRHTHL